MIRAVGGTAAARLILVLAAVVFAAASAAEPRSRPALAEFKRQAPCLVTAISDGDTLKVRCPNQPQQTIRLAQIDAPEKRQPFGERSRQHLAQLCFGQQAGVTPRATDRYGRTVAEVQCQGRDASQAQLEAGMAWVFDRYVTDRGLYGLQEAARAARAGLWADREPVAPWEWRGKAAGPMGM